MLFPPHMTRLITTLMMSVYMVSIMTGVITWVNTGLEEGFMLRWWRAFYIAWPVAFALIYFGAPSIQKLTAKLIRK